MKGKQAVFDTALLSSVIREITCISSGWRWSAWPRPRATHFIFKNRIKYQNRLFKQHVF